MTVVPNNPVMRPWSFRLPDTERAAIKAEAAQAGVTESEWIRFKLAAEVITDPQTGRPVLMIPKQLIELARRGVAEPGREAM